MFREFGNLQSNLLPSQRDILTYIGCRDVRPADDLEVGGLLLKSFTITNRLKSPGFGTNDDRILELLDISARRESGAVRALELGRRVVGTYSLMRPHALQNLSLIRESAHLRCVALDTEFQGIGLGAMLLADAVKCAVAWEVPSISLEIFKGSDALGRFYEKHGFERCCQGDYMKGIHSFEAYLLRL